MHLYYLGSLIPACVGLLATCLLLARSFMYILTIALFWHIVLLVENVTPDLRLLQ